jgi:hypothetical protein
MVAKRDMALPSFDQDALDNMVASLQQSLAQSRMPTTIKCVPRIEHSQVIGRIVECGVKFAQIAANFAFSGRSIDVMDSSAPSPRTSVQC